MPYIFVSAPDWFILIFMAHPAQKTFTCLELVWFNLNLLEYAAKTPPNYLQTTLYLDVYNTSALVVTVAGVTVLNMHAKHT